MSVNRERLLLLRRRRLAREENRLNVMEQLFFAADDISGLSVDELCDKLKAEETLPSGFIFTVVESVLFIYWLQVQDCIPCIKASIAVKNDCTVTVSLEGETVAASQFIDLFKGPAKRLSEIIARIKS
jgi:hypothetical protein